MKLFKILVALAALAVVPAFAQNSFQVKYVPNLNVGDSFVNITNTGAVFGLNLNLNAPPGMAGMPPQIDKNDDLCINIYVFTPDEQEQECCSCLLTSNGLATFSVQNDLTSNFLTFHPRNDVVIKLLATASCIPQATGGCFPQSSAANCNAATAGELPTINALGQFVSVGPPPPSGQPLAPGMRAWGTALHANTTAPPTYQVTETRFETGELRQRELDRITGLCSFIQQNGSGSGICARDHGLCVTPNPPAIR